MGVASAFFFDSDSENETLHRRVTPTDEQFQLQQARWNDLADHLRTDLSKRTGYAIRTWLQGSYKFATQVRPPRKGEEFDIDLGFYFLWNGRPADGEHTPQELRQHIQDSLKSYARSADDVREVAAPKPRCCRIHYDDDFHVDVPCYHLDSDRDARTLATSHGWEESDPKALYKWFKEQFDDAERARVRRQIRYLKAWAGLRFELEGGGRPSSVLLTILAAEAVFGMTQDERSSADDELLHLVLSRIRARLAKSLTVKNPVDEEENLNRLPDAQAKAFRDALKEFHDIAEEAVAAEDEVTAADIWSRAFGHFFPMPTVETASLSESSGALSKALAVSETLPNIMVTAVSEMNAHLSYRGTNRIGPIPKNCRIQFRVENPDRLPAGTTVEWVARNQGAEAEAENDMGHRGKPGATWNDHSAYVGTHFMDVVFRRNGRLVGLRRIPVTITGLSVPRRNPPRPGWVSLRGRR
jgi:hypothetical protein